MKHLEVSALLAEYVSGPRSRYPALEAHLEGCQECRDWVDTYRLLGASLTENPVQPVHDEHPESGDLCDFALDTGGLGLVARERVERHLEDCGECLHEAELVRSAVVTTVDVGSPAFKLAGRIRKFATSPGGLALAAALVLMIGGLVMVDRLPTSIPDQYQLIGQSINGIQVVEANRSIFVEDAELEPGSQLKLNSPVVAFGDGFSVRSGATLVAANHVTDRSSQ